MRPLPLSSSNLPRSSTSASVEEALLAETDKLIDDDDDDYNGGDDDDDDDDDNDDDQGSRKSKIGWELTKTGCHVRFLELSKKAYICSNPYYRGFYASFLGF